MSKVRQRRDIRAAVLRAAGTNCDYETSHALNVAGAKPISIHVRELLDGNKNLADYNMIVIPGGLSYGDDLGAGKLFANEFRYLLSEQVEKFVKSGRPIIGICNGFQVLVKAGLLPEYQSEGLQQEMTLVPNDSARFECRWVFLEPNQESPCIFTQGLTRRISLPVAHAEGKIVFKSQAVQQRVLDSQQVVFQYVTEAGQSGDYPANPNGSVLDIAGICDTSGKILGMMPHPERYVWHWQYPSWTRGYNVQAGEGLRLFQNAVDYCKENF